MLEPWTLTDECPDEDSIYLHIHGQFWMCHFRVAERTTDCHSDPEVLTRLGLDVFGDGMLYLIFSDGMILVLDFDLIRVIILVSRFAINQNLGRETIDNLEDCHI